MQATIRTMHTMRLERIRLREVREVHHHTLTRCGIVDRRSIILIRAKHLKLVK